MDTNLNEIRFDRYCYRCKHKDLDEVKDPCNDCLDNGALLNTKKPLYFEEDAKIKDKYTSGYYSYLSRINDYLYKAKYNNIDYNFAKKYYESGSGEFNGRGCSSIRKGNFFGRNLDWFYNNNVEFVVEHDGTIGMCGGLSQLSKDFVESGRDDELYKLLPFQMYDGMNNHGLVANMNVVPVDYGFNVSIPNIRENERVCGIMLVRYILDNFSNAKDAVEYIRDYVSVYFTNAIHEYGYELHYMIADLDNTYILEFVNNKAIIIDAKEHPYITNFYLHNVELNNDGTVYTPETQHNEFNAMDYNKITKFGSGLERYNLLNFLYNNIEIDSGYSMYKNIMKRLLYSDAYITSDTPSYPYWFTEFVGDRIYCNSSPDKFYDIVNKAGQYYLNRSRDTGLTWHTTHSSVYDIENKIFIVRTQEIATPHAFSL